MEPITEPSEKTTIAPPPAEGGPSATPGIDPGIDEVPLPPERLRFMSDADDRIITVGSHLANQLYRLGLDRESGRYFDVGFGYGRLAIGMIATDFHGTYRGFEILRRHARWCRQNIEPLFGGRYAFRHLDIANGRYNPKGTIPAAEVRFPARTNSHDVVGAFSVFTHMYEADIRRYLRETRRVLRPGGLAVTTWFVYDDQILPQATDPEQTRFPMIHEINAVTRYTEPLDPLRAIAYDEDHVRSMVADAGLRLVSLERGSWSNSGPGEFQDYLVLQKPDPATEPPSGLPTRAVRKARRVAASLRPGR